MISFSKIYRKKLKEMSGDGAVAGYAAPMVVKTKKTDKSIEEDDNTIDKIRADKNGDGFFESKNFEITRKYRGERRGYTLMIGAKDGDGDIFLNDDSMHKLLSFLEDL